MPQTTAIRFAIMCQENILEEWQAQCVEELLSLDNVTLSLLILDKRTAENKNKTFKRFLYRYYRKTWFTVSPRRPVKMDHLFGSLPTIEPVITQKGKFSEYFDENSLEKIISYNLTFILRFAFNIIRGDILTAAQYGVWSYHHDDEQKYRGSPAGFWEIYYADPVTGAVLQRLTHSLDNGIILKKGYFNTISISYIENIRQVYLESAKWPSLICRDIQRGNIAYLETLPPKIKAPLFYPPNNQQMVFFFLKLFRNRLIQYFYDRLN